ALSKEGAALCWGGGLRCVPGEWFEGKHIAVRPSKVPGLDAATEVAAGADQACVVMSGGSVSCARPRGTTGDAKERACVAEPVRELRDVREIAIGDAFSCARVGDHGVVTCWGAGVSPSPIRAATP